MPGSKYFKDLFKNDYGYSLELMTGQALKSIFEDKTNPVPSEDDFIADMTEARRESQNLLSYDDFRKIIKGSKTLSKLPELSPTEIEERKALSEKAAQSLTRCYYRNEKELPSYVTEYLGGNARSIVSVLGKIPDEETCRKLSSGTPHEISEILNDVLKRFDEINQGDYLKEMSDTELADKWPDISDKIRPLTEELTNFMNYCRDRGGNPNTNLYDNVKVKARELQPYFSYYESRLKFIGSDHYAYLPKGIEKNPENFSDPVWEETDDPGVIRTSRDETALQNKCVAMSLFVSNTILGELDFSQVYTKTGELIAADDFDSMGREILAGRELIVYYGQNSEPKVIKAVSLGMPPKSELPVFTEKKYPGIKAKRAAYLAQTAIERKAGKTFTVPSQVQINKAKDLLKREQELVDECVNINSSREIDRINFEEELGSISYAFKHVMRNNIMRVYGLDPKRDEFCIKISNMADEGKSLDDIKAAYPAECAKYSVFLDDLYTASVMDRDSLSVNQEKAKKAADEILIATVGNDERIEHLKAAGFPVLNENERKLVYQQKLDAYYSMTESIFSGKRTSMKVRWAEVINNKPGISADRLKEIARTCETKECKVSLFREFVDDIKAFPPEKIGRINLSEFIENFEAYNYLRLVAFDYSYLNDPDVKEAYDEMFPTEEDKKNFTRYIDGISSTFNSLQAGFKIMMGEYGEVLDFENMKIDDPMSVYNAAKDITDRDFNLLKSQLLVYDNSKINDEKRAEYVNAYKNMMLPNIGHPVLDDITEALYNDAPDAESFIEVRKSYGKLLSALKPVLGKDEALGEKAAGIKKSLDDYISLCSGMLKDSAAELKPETLVALRESLTAVKYYAENISPEKKAGDILSDYSWIKNITPHAAEVKPVKITDAALDSTEKQLTEYRSITSQMRANYSDYLGQVCGDSENPELTVSYIGKLMSFAVNSINNSLPEKSIDLDDLSQTGRIISDIEGYLTPGKNGYKGNDYPAIDNRFFDNLIDKGTGPRAFRENLSIFLNSHKDKLSNSDREIIESIRGYLKNIHFSSEHMGLDDKSRARLDMSAGILSNAEWAINYYGNFIDAERDPMKYEGDSLHGIYTQFYALKEKISDYLNGKEGVSVTENELKPVIDAIAANLADPDSYRRFNVGHKAAADAGVDATMAIVSRYSDIYPQLSEYIQNKIGESRKTLEASLSPLFDEFLNASDERCEEIEKIVTCAFNSEMVSKSVHDAFNIQKMAINSEFRTEFIEKSKNILTGKVKDAPAFGSAKYKEALRNYLIAAHVETLLIPHNEGVTESLLITDHFGSDMNSILFSDRGRFDESDRYVKNFFDRPGIRNLLENGSKEAVDAIVNAEDTEELENLVYGERDLIPEFGSEQMEVFAEGTRAVNIIGDFGYRTTNSPEYDAIGNALKELNGKRKSLEGAQPEDYMKAYEVLLDYARKRNPSPSTSKGKERFNAASDMIYSIGQGLMEKYPEARGRIEKDFKVMALRSSSFRNRLADDNANPKLSDFAKYAKTAYKNSDITDKIKNPEEEKAFLNKYEAKVTALRNKELDAALKNNPKAQSRYEEYKAERAKYVDSVKDSPNFITDTDLKALALDENFAAAREKCRIYAENQNAAVNAGKNIYAHGAGEMIRAVPYLCKTENTFEADDYNRDLAEMLNSPEGKIMFGSGVITELGTKTDISKFYTTDVNDIVLNAPDFGKDTSLAFIASSGGFSNRDSYDVDPLIADFYKYNHSAVESGGSANGAILHYSGVSSLLFNNNMSAEDNVTVMKMQASGQFDQKEISEVKEVVAAATNFFNDRSVSRTAAELKSKGTFGPDFRYLKAYTFKNGEKTRLTLIDAFKQADLDKGSVIFEQMNAEEKKAIDKAFEKPVIPKPMSDPGALEGEGLISDYKQMLVLIDNLTPEQVSGDSNISALRSELEDHIAAGPMGHNLSKQSLRQLSDLSYKAIKSQPSGYKEEKDFKRIAAKSIFDSVSRKLGVLAYKDHCKAVGTEPAVYEYSSEYSLVSEQNKAAVDGFIKAQKTAYLKVDEVFAKHRDSNIDSVMSMVAANYKHDLTEEEFTAAAMKGYNAQKLLRPQDFMKAMAGLCGEDAKTLPSQNEINSRKERQQKAVSAYAKLCYRKSVYNAAEQQRSFCGGSYRAVSTFAFKYGDKDACRLFMEGFCSDDIKARTKAVKDVFSRFQTIPEIFTRKLNDDELAEAFPEIAQYALPLGAELENFIGFAKSKGIDFEDPELKPLVENTKKIAKVVGPCYTYYDSRMKELASEYYPYGPERYSIPKELTMVDFPDNFENLALTRFKSAYDKSFRSQGVAEAYLTKAAFDKNKEIECVYTKEGRRLAVNDTAILGKEIEEGKPVLVYFKGENIPQSITIDNGMPPASAPADMAAMDRAKHFHDAYDKPMTLEDAKARYEMTKALVASGEYDKVHLKTDALLFAAVKEGWSEKEFWEKHYNPDARNMAMENISAEDIQAILEGDLESDAINQLAAEYDYALSRAVSKKTEKDMDKAALLDYVENGEIRQNTEGTYQEKLKSILKSAVEVNKLIAEKKLKADDAKRFVRDNIQTPLRDNVASILAYNQIIEENRQNISDDIIDKLSPENIQARADEIKITDSFIKLTDSNSRDYPGNIQKLAGGREFIKEFYSTYTRMNNIQLAEMKRDQFAADMVNAVSAKAESKNIAANIAGFIYYDNLSRSNDPAVLSSVNDVSPESNFAKNIKNMADIAEKFVKKYGADKLAEALEKASEAEFKEMIKTGFDQTRAEMAKKTEEKHLNGTEKKNEGLEIKV